MRPYSVTADVSQARRRYFNDGVTMPEVIDEAIYRSWERCHEAGLDPRDQIDFQRLGKGGCSDLLEGNRALVEAARSPVDKLAARIVKNGWNALLTDPTGYSLLATHSQLTSSKAIRQAFSQGVDLRESSIGTSAMACAVRENKPVRVFGLEHFAESIRSFNCVASPVFNPQGALVGTIDMTTGNEVLDHGALPLIIQCAREIEANLLQSLAGEATLVKLYPYPGLENVFDITVVLSEEGRILGLDHNGRSYFNVTHTDQCLGFANYFDKPIAQFLGELSDSVPQLIRQHNGISVYARRVSKPRPSRIPGAAVTKSGPTLDADLQDALNKACRAIDMGLPVLITGETGTGKEVAAQALHELSGKAGGPFIAINCAAIPEGLIEGELFGHAEGAFTGAKKGGLKGKIEAADGGTLFLDEIGDMPLQLQARLLRVLETKSIQRLGSTAYSPIDCHLICATHQDIVSLTQKGLFRKDLYYRINGFCLRLPPLRERSDMRKLVDALWGQLKTGGDPISEPVYEALLRYDWPGNVRELKHALTHAYALADDGVLRLENLPDSVAGAATRQADRPHAAETQSGSGVLRALEQQAIEDALARCSGNVGDAARLLGVSRSTLYRKLNRRGANPQ